MARLSLSPLFFAPLVLVGYSPVLIAAAMGLNLLYQFWLHAPWVGRVVPLEFVLNTPAHHRFHHASNAEYLDANFGGVLIVFDRLLGTFRECQAGIRICYGLTDPIESFNPLYIGLREWVRMAGDVFAVRALRERGMSMCVGRGTGLAPSFRYPHTSLPIVSQPLRNGPAQNSLTIHYCR